MMDRLTEWYDDGEHKGVMVKEQFGDKVLKTLFDENDEGYVGMSQLKKYEDTGLTPEQIQEMKERINHDKELEEQGRLIEISLQDEKVEGDELRSSFVNTIADLVLFLNVNTKTEAESELVFLMAVTMRENIKFIPDEQEAKKALEVMKHEQRSDKQKRINGRSRKINEF